MAKMRIHEFAKELDMPGKDVIAILEKIGEAGKTVSSSIDEELQEKVRNHISKGDNAVKADKADKADKAEKTDEKAAPAKATAAQKPAPAPLTRTVMIVPKGFIVKKTFVSGCKRTTTPNTKPSQEPAAGP